MVVFCRKKNFFGSQIYQSFLLTLQVLYNIKDFPTPGFKKKILPWFHSIVIKYDLFFMMG